MRTYLLQVRKRTGGSDVELADRFWVERFAHFLYGEWSMCLGKSLDRQVDAFNLGNPAKVTQEHPSLVGES